jgi:hypothetical protein
MCMSNETAEKFEAYQEVFSSSASAMITQYSRRDFYWTASSKMSVRRSDEDPPIIKDGRAWTDLVPDYELLLGVYDNARHRITLFKKGIDWLAQQHDWEPGRLESIVELHEWGHAVHHLGPNEPSKFDAKVVSSELRRRTLAFRCCPDEFKEQIAQLLTLLAIKGKRQESQFPKAKEYFEIMEEMFFELMDRQSAKYRLPKIVRDMEIPQLRTRAQLLLSMSDAKCPLTLDHVRSIVELS